jgi:chemotaxis protein MotB
MKMNYVLPGVLLLFLFSSCVSTKKFNNIDTAYKKLQEDNNKCGENLRNAQGEVDRLTNLDKNLQAQLDDYKKRLDNANQSNAQILNTLQDLSVMSGKQAESVKKSLDAINEKDSYITGLQAAMARKDSLNMELVMNLKGAIGNIDDKDINIKVEKGVIYVDISDKMLFNSGKYAVTEPAKKVLGKVAKVLNAYPDFEFMVEGHTDNVPISTGCMEDNWDLSVKRATSVIRILQKQYGINPARMAAAGRSEYVPVAGNDNAQGRALNRRTRIIILPQLDQFFKLLVKK